MTWRRRREAAIITRANALELKLAPRSGRRRDESRRTVIVRVDATVHGRTVRGIGEEPPPEPLPALAELNRSWRFLDMALKGLEGRRLPARSARADVLAIVNELRERSGSAAFPVTATEMALLDLAARAQGVPLGTLFGGKRRRVPVINATPVEDLATALESAEQTGDARTTGPLWLQLNGLGVPETRKLVESLVERLRAGQLAAPVIVQPKTTAIDSATLREFQQLADTLMPPRRDRLGIVIMSEGTNTRGIVLDPYSLGGVQRVHDVAHQVTATDPERLIALSIPPHSSGVAGHALVELASALPEPCYVRLPIDEIANHPLHVDPSLIVTDGYVWSGNGPGIGAAFTLSEAVHYVSRMTERSTAPASGSSQPEANVFRWRGARGVNLISYPLERAALAFGLDTTRASTEVFTATHPRLRDHIGFVSSRSAWSAETGKVVTINKESTRQMLKAAGVPVPEGAEFSSKDASQAVSFAKSLGGPVVVKPKAGRKGRGVATDLRSAADIRRAIAALEETNYGGQDFVVERYLTGNDYRVFVVGNKVASVVLRRPACVVGDGHSSIEELVLRKNVTKLGNPHTRTRLIKLGPEAMAWLSRQELTTDSVPEAGREIRLSGAANGSLGADIVEVLDETHPSLLEMAVQATRAIPGLDHAGVDLIGDHRCGVDDQEAAVIEVNDAPGTLLHHFPFYGPPRDVSTDLVLRSCELAGYAPGAPRKTLSVRIQVHGRVQRVEYRQWFARRARQHGVAGSIQNLPSGDVVAEVVGSTDGVSLLASSAFVGPPRARVSYVVTEHVDTVEPTDRFESG